MSIRSKGLASLAGLSVFAVMSACSHPVGSPPYQAELGGSVLNNLRVQIASTRHLTAAEESEVLALAEKFHKEVPNLVYFDFDQHQLLSEAQSNLAQQAQWLLNHPRAAVRIYGHTDKVGPSAYNDELGLRRAEAAASFLQTQGISRNRIQTVSSRGEREPAVDTEAREALNRRTLTAVVGISVNDAPMRTSALFDGRRAYHVYQRYVTDTAPKPVDINTNDVFQSPQGQGGSGLLGGLGQ